MSENAPGLRRFLSLERNVVLVGVAAGLMALGESLWLRYAPLYLEALGASVLVVGLWGSLYDLLDASWQYPGGFIADRLGTKPALIILTLAAMVGLALFLAPTWPVVLFGLVFYVAENAYSQPVTFAVIGDALPSSRRAMGFVVQSAIKRLPQIVGLLGAGYLLVDRFGVRRGVRLAILAALIITLGALLLQLRYYKAAATAPKADPEPVRLVAFPPNLRRLLFSDILVRMGESATRVFIVLYVVNVLGFSPATFAVLASVQIATSLLVYVPAARASDRGRRKPWVALTFLAFALFPLAILAGKTLPLMVGAFLVGGLREIGEPARKASIVDMASAIHRGRVVGTYYALRGFAIVPIAFVAGILWKYSPMLPFLIGFGLSGVGLVLYVVTVRQE